jgi:hypothetical protein
LGLPVQVLTCLRDLSPGVKDQTNIVLLVGEFPTE